jgi:hypothetical protein
MYKKASPGRVGVIFILVFTEVTGVIKSMLEKSKTRSTAIRSAWPFNHIKPILGENNVI